MGKRREPRRMRVGAAYAEETRSGAGSHSVSLSLSVCACMRSVHVCVHACVCVCTWMIWIKAWENTSFENEFRVDQLYFDLKILLHSYWCGHSKPNLRPTGQKHLVVTWYLQNLLLLKYSTFSHPKVVKESKSRQTLQKKLDSSDIP